MRRSLALARHEFRVMRQDLVPMLSMIVMPVALIAFLKPVFRDAIVASGYEGATGAEHAVPSLTVMFAIFLISFTAFAFFREHQWGTWERLRASPARPIEIIVGKVIPSLVVMGVQMLGVFAVGSVLFGFRVRGSLIGFLAIVFAYAVFLVALGVAVVSVCRTANQMNTLVNIGAFVLAGVGGAIAPITSLPDWVARIAPGVPTYWAMRGLRALVLDGAGAAAAILPVIVLGAFAAGMTAVALLRFRFEETKFSWA